MPCHDYMLLETESHRWIVRPGILSISEISDQVTGISMSSALLLWKHKYLFPFGYCLWEECGTHHLPRKY